MGRTTKRAKDMDRRKMANILQDHLLSVKGYFEWQQEYRKGRGPLKTYLIEAHTPKGEGLDHRTARDLLVDLLKPTGVDVAHTEDGTLFQASSNEVGFFFDVLDPRFWVVHTMSNVDVASDILGTLVDQHANLDWAWPPSEMMRAIQISGRSTGFAIDYDETRFATLDEESAVDDPDVVVKFRHRGTGAESWISKFQELAPDAMAFSMVRFAKADWNTGSSIVNELDELGRIKATGNSINLHLQSVALLLDRYRTYINQIEDIARIRVRGNALDGYPVVFHFPKPVAQFEAFVAELLSSKEPLRIWGIPEWIRKDLVYVEGVDLHSSSRMRLDLTPSMMRVYLSANACGNTIARLVRNLQR